MFLAPNFLGEPPPEFLKSIYKIQSDSDHGAKFQGDRSRELGASVAKQKKNIWGRIQARPELIVPGGLMNRENLKFALKFSVLATITSVLVEVSSQNIFHTTCRQTGVITCV